MIISHVSPVETLERLLLPYYALHDAWWRRMLDAAGAAGWTRVAVQQYYIMKAATPLMEFAAAGATRSGHDYAAFADWGRVHAEEEREHYEWFLDDLVAIGCEREVITKSVPDDEILDTLGAQFALAAMTDPTAILGFFFAMECHPSDPEAISELAARLGIPPLGLRTILFHAKEDKEHAKPIVAHLAHHGRDPRVFAAICRSAVRSITGWARLFQRYANEAGGAAHEFRVMQGSTVEDC